MTLADTNEQDNLSLAENNQSTYHTDSNDPYVSTSTSTINRNITFKEFYKNYCSPTVKNNINGSAIALYICCGATAIFSFAISAFGLDLMASLVDAILMLGLALGIHIGKSRACAIIILIYSLINCLYTLVITGHLGGYLIIIAAIYATIYTFKAHKELKIISILKSMVSAYTITQPYGGSYAIN